MKSVGEKLRRERMDRGIDLTTLSALTRIHRRHLEAIESGDMAEIPGSFFYRSFVRQYAAALDLNIAEVEAELDRVKEAEERVLFAALEHAKFPVKMPDPIVMEGNRRYLRTGRMGVYLTLLVCVLVGCSVIYGWWRRLEARSSSRSAEVAEVATPVASAPPSPTPEAPPISQASSPLQTVSHVPVVSKTPPVGPDDRVIVTLAATQDTWVSVYSDGKSVFSGLLRPNQTITLGGKERAQIKLGNAGGVEISWNGKALGQVGPKGHVRTLQLTPETYRIINAPVGSL